MKRIALIALACLSIVGVAAASSLAANGNKSVIYDSTMPNGAPTNQDSLGAEAYAFNTIGDKINFAQNNARSLTSVTVTMSSRACQHGTWQNQSCTTQSGASFSQPITLSIYMVNGDGTTGGLIASSTQTFNISYRPSADPRCLSGDPDRPGGWYQPSTKTCKNGLTQDVTFNFSNQKLDDTVIYEISYNTSDYGPTPLHVSGPYDSLNVAITSAPTVGTSTDTDIWTDGAQNSTGAFANGTPAVQFKASNAS